MSRQKFSGDIARLDNPKRQKVMPVDLLIETLEPISDDMVIADLGCGTGYLTIPLAKHINGRGDICAVDINPEMLAIVKERAKGLNNVKIVKSEENNIPLPDGLVDVSYLLAVYHELNDPVKFLMEIRRISKPVHRIVIVDWNDVRGEMGPPMEERIHENEVINLFRNWGYGLIKKFAPSPYVYGLVFKVSTCKPLDRCWA